MSTKKVKRRLTTFVCGPVPGGRGYLDWCEHAEQKRKRKGCESGCFFCEHDRHAERYEYVYGEWRDKVLAKSLPPAARGGGGGNDAN